MSIELRVALFIGALCTMIYFLMQIRKNRLQIDYTISWTLFSALVLLLSIFPKIATKMSYVIGFESPANMVYLIVIFILIIKLFTTTIKLSDMDRKVTDLAQHIALMEEPRQKEQTNRENQE